jgi:hypothetical protein
MLDERELTLARLVTNPLPERVVIGAVAYRIVLVSESVALSDGYRARIDHEAQVLWIKDSMRPAFAADCLIHEILHGCYQHFGITERKDEEYTVNAIAACLCAVFVHNPKIRDWINWALGGGELTRTIDPSS